MTKMTAVTVEKIKPGESRIEKPDTLVKGLVLVVQTTGSKSWQLRYRASGVRRRMALGSYPDVSLADARKAATEALVVVTAGGDPVGEKRAEKVVAELSERDQVKNLVEQFAKRHLSTLRSGATVKRELERHVVSVWGERDIHSITKRDVIDLLDGIADSGRVVSANRVRAYIGKFFAWCVERDVIDQSPAAGVRPVAKERSRERVLSDDEIRWLWTACDRVGQPWGHLGKMLLLTGQRLGEVCGMTDREIDGDLWSLSGERTKNGRAHTVPLSGAALDVLASVGRIKGARGLILTTTGTSTLSGYTKGRNHLAEAMAEIASEEQGEPIEIDHWTFHDLRRTCATGMARLGISVRVTECVLNHVSGTGGGIVAVYQRHDYAEEKRHALDAWASFVTDLVKGRRADNVVKIHA